MHAQGWYIALSILLLQASSASSLQHSPSPLFRKSSDPSPIVYKTLKRFFLEATTTGATATTGAATIKAADSTGESTAAAPQYMTEEEKVSVPSTTMAEDTLATVRGGGATTGTSATSASSHVAQESESDKPVSKKLFGGFFTPYRIQYARELLAEALGTGLIVFWGTGAVMSAVFKSELVGLFQIAAVWIIAVTLAIATTASISGAHLNPAISICFALLRPNEKFGWGKVIPYCIAQTVGAVIASWCNLLMYASVIREFEAVNNILRSGPDAIGSAKAFGEYFLPPVTVAQAFFAEAIGTAVLAGVIFALTHPGNDTQKHNVYIPPLIGMTVGGLISIIAPLTQAGFNPARDFGPRIVAYAAGWTGVAFRDCWLYIVAPIVGAPIGAAFIDFILYSDQDQSHTSSTSSE